MEIPLDGPGVRNIGYYLDRKWHHFVFKFDAQSGRKAIWIDGKTYLELNDTIVVKDQFQPWNCRSVTMNHQLASPGNYLGDLDELVLYNEYIPDSVHQQHYFAFLSHRPYTFDFSLPGITKYQSPPPFPTYEIELDSVEYGLGYPGIATEPMNQLASFPLPRYKSGHTLMPLFPWFNIANLGGWHRQDISRSQAIINSVSLSEELSRYWHYYLSLGNAATFHEPYSQAMVALANRCPELPLSIVTLWPQTRLEGGQRAHILQKDLPPSFYLRNGTGQFIDANGKADPKARFISPAAPDGLFRLDGESQRDNLRHFLQALERPIQFINENGEAPPLPYKHPVLEQDPEVVNHKAISGYTDWTIYQARQKNRMREAYRDGMLDSIPALSEAHFTWYGIDGGPENLNRFAWKEARMINRQINGQYYSTPDFYPRWPDNWAKWRGPWRGFAWLNETRPVEIESGDNLFSPFVAAGWDLNPEKDIRPSQWLGLLKTLGPIGAEFFYVGYFNESIGDNYPDPREYVWQVAIPAYAQAITSFYEDILRKGSLLVDEKNNPIIRHWVGDPRILVTIRKSNNDNRYIIAGNINPTTNWKGEVPDSILTTLEIEKRQVQCWFRRQGSVYLYQPNAPTGPLFFQLDSWHEKGHPQHWSKNMTIEAELFHSAQGMDLFSHRPEGRKDEDFSAFSSGITPVRRISEACYFLSFRPQDAGPYGLWARVKSPVGERMKFKLSLDGAAVRENDLPLPPDYQWIQLAKDIDLSNGEHELSLEVNKSNIFIDKIELRPR